MVEALLCITGVGALHKRVILPGKGMHTGNSEEAGSHRWETVMSQTRIHAEQSEQKELRVHDENWPVTQDLSLSYCTPKWEPEEGKADRQLVLGYHCPGALLQGPIISCTTSVRFYCRDPGMCESTRVKGSVCESMWESECVCIYVRGCCEGVCERVDGVCVCVCVCVRCWKEFWHKPGCLSDLYTRLKSPRRRNGRTQQGTGGKKQEWIQYLVNRGNWIRWLGKEEGGVKVRRHLSFWLEQLGEERPLKGQDGRGGREAQEGENIYIYKEGMETHSSILAGKSHGQEPGGLQPMGLQRVRHDWATKHIYVVIDWFAKLYGRNQHNIVKQLSSK